MNRTVVVVGSLNADLVLRAPRLPLPGETLAAEDLAVFPGGKGANQACAAARLGAGVVMFGMVGKDVFAGLLLDSLERSGVNPLGVDSVGRATGVAAITVLPHGENTILLSPGANACVSATWVNERLSFLSPDHIVMCQLEIPEPAVEALLKLAAARGATCMLDPAPARPLEPGLLRLVRYVTPNQTEAAILAGKPDSPPQNFAQAAEVSRTLRRVGVRTVILKMGAAGVWIAGEDEEYAVPGFPMDAKDTTAAGDTFNGALAAALAEGRPLREAAEFANAAAAISVTRPGAQASIPDRTEVSHFLKGQARFA